MAVGTSFLSGSLVNWSRPCGLGLGVTVGSSYTHKKSGCKDSSHPSPTLQCSAPEGPRASYKFSPKLSQGWDKTYGIYSKKCLSSASRIIYTDLFIRTFIRTTGLKISGTIFFSSSGINWLSLFFSLNHRVYITYIFIIHVTVIFISSYVCLTRLKYWSNAFQARMNKFLANFLILALTISARSSSVPPAKSHSGADDSASTLAFVFDVTGSMYDDLKQVIDGASRILERTLSRRTRPIRNFVLVPFHDPGITKSCFNLMINVNYNSFLSVTLPYKWFQRMNNCWSNIYA